MFRQGIIHRSVTSLICGLTLFVSSPTTKAATTSESLELKPNAKRILRVDTGISQLKTNINGKYLAYVPEGKLGLRVLSMDSGKIMEPSGRFIGPSFFWSPDGARLFFRELRTESGKTISYIRAWDIAQNKNIEIENFPGSSGFLTFDPRDHRILVMYDKGIKSKKLAFPDNRLANWQSSQRNGTGKWVMAQKGGVFLTESGFTMQKLSDDGSGIESFDVSPDGSTAAWATRAGRIYTSKNGLRPDFIDWGRDPKWHPERPLLVYAGGRMVGNKAADYDLKVASPGARGSFLTATQHTSERWPVWKPDGKSIFYTVEGSTEIRSLEFVPQITVIASPHATSNESGTLR
jgi:Tol biopolymer transport system component